LPDHSAQTQIEKAYSARLIEKTVHKDPDNCCIAQFYHLSQNNVHLGLQSLQEKILAIQQQLTAISQTKIQQKSEQAQTPKKTHALPSDPWIIE
jgi:hypothetical protein